MKPVRSVKNQYLGINAHLHSYWQAKIGWDGFHIMHIGDLIKRLRGQLLPMGYTANLERSLQTRHTELTMYSEQPAARYTGSNREMVLPIPQALRLGEPAEKQYWAIAIHFSGEGREQKPVAWLELLAPSNKPGGQYEDHYVSKRASIVSENIVYIELDYLNESSPTIDIADNRDRGNNQPGKPDSNPYRILVVDPHPAFMEGNVHIIEFDVDQAIPRVKIPLNADDVLEFDFGAPYAKTFEETFYGVEVVDYSQLPQNFDRYSEADQARIVARMLTVVEAAQSGKNLEDGPFPVKPVTLKEGLAQLEMRCSA